MQDPNALLTILSKMAQKPEVQFEKLYQKLYNIELWLLAYQRIAPKPGNMTTGIDGKTIDGVGLKLIGEDVLISHVIGYRGNELNVGTEAQNPRSKVGRRPDALYVVTLHVIGNRRRAAITT